MVIGLLAVLLVVSAGLLMYSVAFKSKNKKKIIRLSSIFTLLFLVMFLFAVIIENEDNVPSEKYEIVYNNPWNSSVSQVERFLKTNLKDPESFEAIEWSTVKKFKDRSFMVRCKYRAKNSFDGYIVKNQVFSLDSTGTVIKTVDYDKFVNNFKK